MFDGVSWFPRTTLHANDSQAAMFREDTIEPSRS